MTGACLGEVILVQLRLYVYILDLEEVWAPC